MNYFLRVHKQVYRLVHIKAVGKIPCIKDVTSSSPKRNWVPIDLNAPHTITCKCCILDTSWYISTEHWEI